MAGYNYDFYDLIFSSLTWSHPELSDLVNTWGNLGPFVMDGNYDYIFNSPFEIICEGYWSCDKTTIYPMQGEFTISISDDVSNDLPDDQFIDEAEADEATKNQLKLILLIIVIALLFVLYVVSRGDDDDLLTSQTTVIDKIWDDDDINEPTNVSSPKSSDSGGQDDSIDIKDKIASAMKSSGLSAVRLFTAIDQTDDGYVSRREIRTVS